MNHISLTGSWRWKVLRQDLSFLGRKQRARVRGGGRSGAVLNHASELWVCRWRGPVLQSRSSGRRWEGALATLPKLHLPVSSRCQNYLSRKPERDSSCLSLLPANWRAENMWSYRVWRLLLSESSVGCRVFIPCGRFSPALRRGERGPMSPRPVCVLGRRSSCLLRRAGGGRGATPSSPVFAGLCRPSCRGSPREGRGQRRGPPSSSRSTPLKVWGARLTPGPQEPRQASL